MLNSAERISEIFNESIQTISAAIEPLSPAIANASKQMFDAIVAGQKILACGNGGSATDALHFSAELQNRFETERLPLPGIALTADAATITAIANDYDFDQVFAKQVQAIGQPGDILLAITTSGNSGNILKAIEAAHERELFCITLNGKNGGTLTSLLNPIDINICVPSHSTARIQEVHGIIVHCFCDLIDRHLLGNGEDNA